MPPTAPLTSASLTLTLTAELATARRYLPFLRRHLKAAHAILHPPLVELSVVLVGDRTMSALHAQFMNIPGPTDVLTFPLETGPRGRVLSGEVVVCVPEARRRSRQERNGLEQELLLYALHGLLHLAGYDDRTERAFVKMHRTEDQILEQLGIGPVFAGSAARRTTRRKGDARAQRRKSAGTG